MPPRFRSLFLAVLLLAFALAIPAIAQYANVSANLTDITGSSSGSAYLHFDLRNCGANFPVVKNAGFLPARTTYDFRPDPVSGLITGQVIGTDQILCGNVASTYYDVSLMKDAEQPIAPSPVSYLIAAGTNWTPAAQPMSNPPAAPGFVYVFGNPTGSQVVTQPNGTSIQFVGAVDFSQAAVNGLGSNNGAAGATGAVQVKATNGNFVGDSPIYADQYSTVQAAIAAVPATQNSSQPNYNNLGPGMVIIPTSVAQPGLNVLDYGGASNGYPIDAGTALLWDQRKGFYFTGSNGFAEGLIASNWGDPILKVRRSIATHNSSTGGPPGTADYLRMAADFEAWTGELGSTGNCQAGSTLSSPLNLGVSMDFCRGDTADVSGFEGLNIVIGDFTGSGLSTKGPIRGSEIDLANNSGSDAVFNSSSAGGDTAYTGGLIICTGTKACGIGNWIRSTDAGPGNWQRGEVIQDWTAGGYGLNLIRTHVASANALVFDNITAGDTESILFNDAGSARWTLSGPTAFTLYDALASIDRLNFPQVSSSNAESRINSVGSYSVAINKDTNAGSGGLQICTGGGSPSCGAPIANSANVVQTVATIVTTAAASDACPSSACTAADAGLANLTASSHCYAQATNATAAGLTGVYVVAGTAALTLYHSSSANGNFNVACSMN
jgi:hypothetical protein